MNVEYAFLCDYAEAGSKLAALGIGIDSIYAESIPVVHPQIFAVLALKFTINETNRTKTVEMRIQDADAKDIAPPVVQNIQIQPPAQGMTYRTFRVVSGLYGLRFKEFGDYQISWLLDGVEVHAVHFRLVHRPEPSVSN
jgi:hypothetical protein